MSEQSSTQPRAIQVYSLVFSIVVMAMLVSFLAVPDLDLASLSDNMRWRQDLIALYGSLRLKLGDQVFNKAVVGKDGWIFYTGEFSIPDYQNSAPFSEERLQSIQKALDQLSSELEKQGKTLLVVIAPNKSTIYAQYMPAEIPVLGERSRLDQFTGYMQEHGSTRVIDLRQDLISASREHDVYYKVDTHWNDMGAYYAYREILDALSSRDPRLHSHPLSDFDYTMMQYNINPDLPRALGLPVFAEPRWKLTPRFPVQELTVVGRITVSSNRELLTLEGTDKNLPSLLVYHDSFYAAYGGLSHLLEPNFRRIITVPFVAEPAIWSLDWIQKEGPDIVIIEVVERYLNLTLPKLLGLD
ncbi:MAG: hypothetical protein HY869_09985 [Chloroflexi bacterium]|nr:hypothetical protein [Chloroflexota bacterium]